MHREISEEFRVENIRKRGRKEKNTHDRARRGEESRLAWCNAASRTSRWLHHVLDLPCRSSWRPSSLARTHSRRLQTSPFVCMSSRDRRSNHLGRLPSRRSFTPASIRQIVRRIRVRYCFDSPNPLHSSARDTVVAPSPRHCQRSFTSRDVA